jgi:hypothetical protein
VSSREMQPGMSSGVGYSRRRRASSCCTVARNRGSVRFASDASVDIGGGRKAGVARAGAPGAHKQMRMYECKTMT